MVIICVPVYKKALNPLERFSLRQLNLILPKYKKVFVAPESLEFDYGDVGRSYQTERFPDQYFLSVESYSRLMLTKDFYQRFTDFQYMLLYQLDAFVFSDRLMEFCRQGFDYIGAPVYRFTPHWHAIHTCVGNGGFSLRKISSALRMLDNQDDWMKRHPFRDVFLAWEDLFWGYCGKNDQLEFKIPTEKEALEFAVQDDVCHVYRKMLKNQLPFGCHGWYKHDIEFWKIIFSYCGYDLSRIHGNNCLNYRQRYIRKYLVDREKMNFRPLYGYIRRKEYEQALCRLLQWLFSYSENNMIWQQKIEEFICLWRMCRIDIHDEHDNILCFMEEAIMECIRRTMITGRFVQWQIVMVQELLAAYRNENYNSAARLSSEVRNWLNVTEFGAR